MFHKLVVIARYGQRLQDDDLDYKATRETRVSQSVIFPWVAGPVTRHPTDPPPAGIPWVAGRLGEKGRHPREKGEK